MIRYRTDGTSEPGGSAISAQWFPPAYTAPFNPNEAINTAFVTFVQHLWDDPSGSRKVTKPCTHLQWTLSGNSTFGIYSPNHTGNGVNPGLLYGGVRDWYVTECCTHKPSSVFGSAGSYIPITAMTSGDIENCVFMAYNRYVNSITALDASTSIAELGETPALFRLWQRRLRAPSNIVNGFLAYSFGWKPLLRDLIAISAELRRFPATVRKRLKAIGNGDIVRHYKFDLTSTVNDLNVVVRQVVDGARPYRNFKLETKTTYKSRIVIVTVRAKVKPKLGPGGQELLNKLGALGLIPSLATVWSVTRLSFVVDWAFNIGAAIENLQGCLTHDVSDVRVCVSDLRVRSLTSTATGGAVQSGGTVGVETQRYYSRSATSVPMLPSLTIPRRPMQYVLLGMLALVNTSGGKKALALLDNTKVSRKISEKLNKYLDQSYRYRGLKG